MARSIDLVASGGGALELGSGGGGEPEIDRHHELWGQLFWSVCMCPLLAVLALSCACTQAVVS